MDFIKNRRETSPQTYAKIGGILYLMIIGLGIFYELIVRDRIMVAGNASATVENLRSMEFLWRLGIVAELMSALIGVSLIFILYKLTKPVNRDLAMLAALFNLVACTIQITYILQLVEALFPIGTAEYLKAFTPEQLDVMVNLTMKSHVFGFGIALLMFGPFFLLTGYLIYKSNYIPKLIGVLYTISGAGYLVNGFMLVLAPQFSGIVFTIIVLPVFIGEISLALTLLVKGVNEVEWNKYWAKEY